MPAGNNIGSAQLISLNPSVQTFTDSVQFGLPDFYSFVIPGSSSSAVSITLSGLAADANLELLNGAGTTVVDSSNNTGTLVDVVNTLLVPGTYYIRVTPGAPSDPANSATTTSSTPYSLSFASDNGIRADLGWHNIATNQTAVWSMSGTTLNEGPLSTPVGGPGWQLQAGGDFNGDGDGDFVWRNFITGQNAVWFMNGPTLGNSVFTTPVISDLNWEIRGAGDFDANGKNDWVWRNKATGQIAIWFLDGVNLVSGPVLSQIIPNNWEIQGAGDFNGDGKADIVWRDTITGRNDIWFMDGSTLLGATTFGTVADSSWEIRGTGDFNQDGQTDLLWRNKSTGRADVWFMNGATFIDSVTVSPLIADTNWQVRVLPGRKVPVPLRDIAGNTLARVLNVGTVDGSGIYRGAISSSNPTDYYQFTVPTTGRVGLTFGGVSGGNLTGDLDLILSNATGTFNRSLLQSALTPETLIADLAAGTYTVRVLPKGAAASTYQLGLSILPTLVSNNPVTLSEGATQTISSSSLLVSEGAKSPGLITYSVVTAPSSAAGNLSLGGIALVANSTFTQADINAGRLTYRQNGSETPTSDSFVFSVSTGSGGPLPTTIAPTPFSLNFLPSNDAPILLSTNLGLTITEGSATAITSTLLSATDIEQTPAQLVYSITSAPTNGSIIRAGVALTTGGTFTQADVNTGTLLSYSHNGSESVTDGFTFSLSDGAGGFLTPPTLSLSIAVIGTDDPPVLVSNTGITLAEFQSRLLATSLLSATDVDTVNPDLIVYSVISAPTNGTLSRGNLSQISSFTQADLNNGRIVYGHNRPQTNTDTFTFTVSNPGGPVGTVRTFNIAVTGVNFIPAIATNNPLTLSEGTTAALTTSLLQVSDADGAAPQLTYSLISAPVNGSITKVGFGTLSAGSTFTQLDIDTTGRINYVNNGSESSSDRFVFSVTDQGGAQLANQTFSISVLPVNDAPTIVSNLGITASEGATVRIPTSLLSASDVDTPVAQLVYSVTTAPTNGALLLNQSTLNGTFTQADINGGLLSYRHNGSESLADSFGFSLSDGQAPALNGIFTIGITPVNDVPSLVSNSGFTLSEGTAFTITSTELFITDFDGGPAPSPIYTLASAPTAGTLQLSGAGLTIGSTFTQSDIDNGQIRYQNNGSESSRDRFTFTASDGSPTGQIAITPVSITVINTNDPPTLLSKQPLTLNEQATSRISTSLLSASDADTPSNQLVYSVINAPANGVLLLNQVTLNGPFTQADLSSGLLSYRHNGSETLTDSFEFSLSDGNTTLNSDIFNIVVNPVNDPLTIVANTGLTVSEASTTTITPTALFITDVDGPGTSPTYTLVSLPTAGVLQLSGAALSVGNSFAQSDIDSGLLTYLNNGSETSRDRFTFSASDGGPGGTITNTNFSITITNVNDTPTLVSLPTSVNVSEETSFTLNGANRIFVTDPDTTSLTATLAASSGTLTVSTFGVAVSGNASGNVVLSGTVANLNSALNTLAYRGVKDFNGEDSLTVSVSDGTLAAAGTVSINVAPVNDAPVLTVPITQSIAEDQPLSFSGLFTFSDVDAGVTPESVLLSVSNGTLTVGSFPSLQFLGGDPLLGSNTLSFSGTADDVQLALNSLVYTGRSNFNGSDRLTITVNDNGTPTPLSVTRSVPITVTAVNDAPTFTAGPDVISVNEDSVAYSQLWATGISRGGGSDEQSQTLSFLVTNDNSAIFTSTGQPKISTSTGALTFTLSPNANTATGPVTVTVNLRDSGNGTNISGASTFTINVNPVNDAPTFVVPTSLRTVTVAEDAGPQSILWANTISAGPNEVGQNLTFTLDQLSTTNAGLFLPGAEPTIDPATGRLIYQTAPDANGTAIFRATLIDDGGTDNGFGATGVDRSSQTFTINVTSVNDAPVLTVPVGPLNIDEDVRLFIPDISVTDVDAGATNVRVTLSAASGNLSLGTAPTGVTVTGNNSRTVILAGSQAAIAPVLSTLSYQTTANFAGPTDTLTIRASDTANAFATQSLAILINPVNDAPTLTINPTTLTAQEDVSLNIGSTVIRGTDVDSGSVTVTVTADNGGTLSLAGQSGATITTTLTAAAFNSGLSGLSYRSAQDYNGPDSLTVTVDDGAGGIVEQSLSVNVQAVNDAPVLTVPTTAIPAVQEGSPILFSGNLSVTDVDSALITVGLAVQNGTVTLGALAGLTIVSGTNGSARITYAGAPDVVNSALADLTYNPNAFYNGADTLTITATDGVTPAPTRTLSLTVTPVNDPPVLTRNATLAVLEGNVPRAVPITTQFLSATDPDSPPATSLVYSVTAAPSNGTLLRNGVATTSFTQADLAAGVVTYTHNGSETTVDSFSFQLTDGSPANALPPTVFNISVTPLNDAPVLATPNPTIAVSRTNRTVVLSGGNVAGQPNQLLATDVDTLAPQLVYRVDQTSSATFGSLLKSGVPLNIGDTFTQADINSGLVSYNYAGAATGTAIIVLQISDGTTSFSVSLNVTAT